MTAAANVRDVREHLTDLVPTYEGHVVTLDHIVKRIAARTGLARKDVRGYVAELSGPDGPFEITRLQVDLKSADYISRRPHQQEAAAQ